MNHSSDHEYKVYVRACSEMAERLTALRESIGWLQTDGRTLRGTRVFLKPNLTWREPMPGITTTPAFIKGAVAIFKEWTDNILIGESDGGYHSFPAEEAFRSHDLYDLSQRYGIKVVNLSHVPVEKATAMVLGKPVTVEVPSFLLHEVDVFVTLPVPKVHAMTQVSLGFKNQWGCQPGTMRLLNHPDFTRKILAINKLLKPRFALYDGTYFLNQNGPMKGEPVRMDLTIVADDVGAGDLVCCEIMGFDPKRARHLRFAQQEGMMPRSLEEITLNQALSPFQLHRFRLKRTLINWIALAAFHNHLATHLFYDSLLAGPLHTVLYTIRRNPIIGRLLYGPTGPLTVEGHRR